MFLCSCINDAHTPSPYMKLIHGVISKQASGLPFIIISKARPWGATLPNITMI